MITLRIFLFTLVTVMARPSFEGFQGFPNEPKFISESVHLREIPTKIIKVTKTVAIKVPVPYPVKVPHHIPFPVPVKQPVAVPVTKIVKVPQHVPVTIEKPVPIELHQQIPFLISRSVPIPHPVPVPHPITLTKAIFIPVPKPIPFPQVIHEMNDYSSNDNDNNYNLYEKSDDHVAHETKYSDVNVQNQKDYDQENNDQKSLQPSQPDYSNN